MTVSIHLRLPDDLHARVKAAAKADDRPMHTWLLRAIDHELSRMISEPVRETFARDAAAAVALVGQRQVTPRFKK